MNSQSPEDIFKIAQELPDFSPRILLTYIQLWQLEIWLRHMVYIELKARDGESWSNVVQMADMPRKADKRLTHMPTPESEPLSYAGFSELMRLISESWDLFSQYLPPENIWKARIDELAQVRNRVAHFRRGHPDDLQRVNQLLRDIDKGFWLFCTSYNDSNPVLPQKDDPVTQEFLALDPFPYSEIEKGKWARFGQAPPGMKYMVTIETLKRVWAKTASQVDGSKGYLYDIRIHARDQRIYDYRRLLEDTQDIHQHFVHICLDKYRNSIRVTVPAIIGSETVIKLVKRLIKITGYTIHPGPQDLDESDNSVQILSEEWPEFILGPENPLTFLGPGMPCRFFSVQR
jgi:hypothetical protein